MLLSVMLNPGHRKLSSDVDNFSGGDSFPKGTFSPGQLRSLEALFDDLFTSNFEYFQTKARSSNAKELWDLTLEKIESISPRAAARLSSVTSAPDILLVLNKEIYIPEGHFLIAEPAQPGTKTPRGGVTVNFGTLNSPLPIIKGTHNGKVLEVFEGVLANDEVKPHSYHIGSVGILVTNRIRKTYEKILHDERPLDLRDSLAVLFYDRFTERGGSGARLSYIQDIAAPLEAEYMIKRMIDKAGVPDAQEGDSSRVALRLSEVLPFVLSRHSNFHAYAAKHSSKIDIVAHNILRYKARLGAVIELCTRALRIADDSLCRDHIISYLNESVTEVSSTQNKKATIFDALEADGIKMLDFPKLKRRFFPNDAAGLRNGVEQLKKVYLKDFIPYSVFRNL